jgi:hypothetical protein
VISRERALALADKLFGRFYADSINKWAADLIEAALAENYQQRDLMWMNILKAKEQEIADLKEAEKVSVIDGFEGAMACLQRAYVKLLKGEPIDPT